MTNKSERGLALVVSLAVLVVSALLGLSSYQASQLEERMAGNHRFSISALQAAEAGVNNMLTSVLAYSYSPGSNFCDDISASLSGTDFTTSEDGGYSYYQSVTGGDINLRYKALMKCNSASGHVLGFSRGVVLGSGGEDISARRLRVEIVPPGFDSINSMLADGNISIPGNSTIVGVVHSNANVDISLKSTGSKSDRIVSEGSITATGTVNVSGAGGYDGTECADVVCAASGAPEQRIPSAQELIDEAVALYLEVNADGEVVPIPGKEGFIEVLPYDADGNCSSTGSALTSPITAEENIDENSPGRGEFIYYCPGSIDTTDNFSGVTIMAEGDIVHRGVAEINDEGNVDTFVVSGGNIALNGATDAPTYASFFSEGSFTQNGSSHIFGAIVAGTTITSNGGIVFTARETGKILVPVSGRLEGWMELESPSDEANLTAGEA